MSKAFDLESTELELRAALRNAECERQTAQDEAAKLRTQLLVAEQTIARLELAAPVMLTAMAFAADEADADGIREILALWLDAEHRNDARAAERAAKESA